jgi:hypothetical protein
MTSQTDLFAQWAAEEFVAAGRVSQEQRDMHRRRGAFYADVMDGASSPALAPAPKGEVGKLLRFAFDR